MSLFLPTEFPIKLGMLAQYKLKYLGLFFSQQPTKAFNEYPQCFPQYPNPISEPDGIPKYTIHVVGELVMRDLTLERVGTRYLKCFITIPERRKNLFEDKAIEAETFLVWVLDTWLEPLEERSYQEVITAEKRNIAKKYLERLNKTGRILPSSFSSPTTKVPSSR